MNKLIRMPARLAIRHEGEFINAYFALDDTMKNARLLGSLTVWVASDAELYNQWKEVMRESCVRQVQAITGITPVFDSEVVAPEHERSGHG